MIDTAAVRTCVQQYAFRDEFFIFHTSYLLSFVFDTEDIVPSTFFFFCFNDLIFNIYVSCRYWLLVYTLIPVTFICYDKVYLYIYIDPIYHTGNTLSAVYM